jgi:hypothetical protein
MNEQTGETRIFMEAEAVCLSIAGIRMVGDFGLSDKMPISRFDVLEGTEKLWRFPGEGTHVQINIHLPHGRQLQLSSKWLRPC